jgi:DNA-binding NarL/FixJ family response regulator
MMKENKIKVVLLDDHPMIIEGLCNIISIAEDVQITGKYTRPAALLRDWDQLEADILLLDIQMPERSGDSLLDAPVYVNNLLRAGAGGYITKTIQPDLLIDTIRRVARGEIVLAPGLDENMEQFRRRSARGSYLKPALTSRETEILQYIVDGYSNKAISEALYLSNRTVESYRNNILLKLDVQNTAALVKKALQTGLAT